MYVNTSKVGKYASVCVCVSRKLHVFVSTF